jgi:nucleoid-associated protein YgaU
MARAKKSEDSYFDRLEDDIKSNQNTLSLVLGALIVVVVGVLLFNYFNKQEPQISDTAQNQEVAQAGDVAPTNLPGEYTVKDGDTLFTIAEKYYGDGYKYNEIVTANSLTSADMVTTGQKLTIPKVEGAVAGAVTASPSPEASVVAEASPTMEATPAPVAQEPTSPSVDNGTGGGNTTIWGPKIEGDTYTVAEGDWLSTISARAYGDIQSFSKIAQANNIQNPDLIVPGTVLKLPR